MAGVFRVWKYDTHKSDVYRKFVKMQELQHKNPRTSRTFLDKTKGFCKKERKRTGCCGLCLCMEKLEYILDSGGALDKAQKDDHTMLLKHKVCSKYTF